MRVHLAMLAVLLQALLCVVPVRAQGADQQPGFSLQDALRLLRERHPWLQGAQAAVGAAQADQDLTQLWTNPVLSASYTNGVRRSSYDESGYISYGVTQFLELAGAPAARKQAAGLLLAAARADREALLLSLSLDVESALIDVVATSQKLVLVERALGLVDHAVTIVGQRVSAGAAPRYDATRIAVTAANAHADLESLRADLASASGELRAAVGPGHGELRGLPSYPLAEEPALPALEQLLTSLVRARPDLQAARSRAASAQAEVGVARRSVFPGVSVSVLGGFGAAPGQQDVGVGLSVPLPVANRGQGAISGAQARTQQAAAYVQTVLVTAQARIQGLREQVLARRRALADYTQRAVVSGDEMLQEAQAGYLAGRFSVLELADAYSAWRGARLRVLELQAAARQAEVDLSRQLGVPLRDIR